MLVRPDLPLADEIARLAGAECPRAGGDALVMTLPLPPSVNRMWTVRAGRFVKTDEYAGWKRNAAWEVRAACVGRAPLVHFAVTILAPPMAKDLDNIGKGCVDALQAGCAVVNDKGLRRLVLAVDDAREDRATCLIELRAASGPSPAAQKETRRDGRPGGLTETTKEL